MVIIKQQFVQSREKTFPGTNGRKYITIHETGNASRGANAQMHANLQTSGFSASWHWQVDDQMAIQSFPHTVRCWHAGDGAGDGNYHSIAIEICINADGNYRQALNNAAALVRKIMREEEIPLINVVQHNKWNGKDCPHYLRAGDKGINWSSFKQLIQNNDVSVKTSNILSLGSKGEMVKKLQTDLNRLGYQLAVDGSFGPATDLALRGFQASKNLEIDGSFGPITQKALNDALTKLSSTSIKVLKSGDKGENVKTLQSNLNQLGYKLVVDGSFGPATEKAVREFQASEKLAVDGLFGPLTQKALNNALIKAETSVSNVLKSGHKGERVKRLQKDLNKLGYELAVDGSFGPSTEMAVRSFQASRKLAVDGLFGPLTQKALAEALAKPIRFSSTKVLRYGDKGAEVRAMQEALASVYFYPDKGAKNNGIDGSFGPKTLDALRRFQSIHTPAEVDGVFGPKTQAALQLAIQNKAK